MWLRVTCMPWISWCTPISKVHRIARQSVCWSKVRRCKKHRRLQRRLIQRGRYWLDTPLLPPSQHAMPSNGVREAAALEPHPTTPVADAITYFTRAMGSARRSDLASARKEIAQLKQIKDALVESKQDYWAEQTDIQVSAVSAWVAYAEGKKAEAVKLMRSAADREDASEKHVAMENRLWPMRELLGDLLLAMHQ